MMDKMVTLGNTRIQHGKNSNRVYIMKLDKRDLPGVLDAVEALARREGYTKLFAKIPVSAARWFLEHGYGLEARVPYLFRGIEEGVFASRFLDTTRARAENAEVIAEVLSVSRSRAGNSAAVELPAEYETRALTPDDAPQAAEVYRQVFATYPFPIHNPDYIRATMADHVLYFGAFQDGVLGALASAEMDPGAQNAEMTDFATLPQLRGKGLARHLLAIMEQAVRKRTIRTAYTIARAVSHGMNITFAESGYSFAGTLINNTHISGGLESMNVWHKRL